MSELIAIAYPDTTTAYQASEEAERLAQDLVIEPDAIAVIVRNQDGKYKVTTNHHPVGAGCWPTSVAGSSPVCCSPCRSSSRS